MLMINSFGIRMCQECNTERHGVHFTLATAPPPYSKSAFLCWKHFRKTLKAMCQTPELSSAWKFVEIDEGTVLGNPGVTLHQTESKASGKSWGHSVTHSESIVVNEGESHPKGESGTS